MTEGLTKIIWSESMIEQGMLTSIYTEQNPYNHHEENTEKINRILRRITSLTLIIVLSQQIRMNG